MLRSDAPNLGQVGHRLGRLEPAWVLEFPNLPNLPNLSPHVTYAYVRRCRRVCAYARTGTQIYVGKVRKVRKSKAGQGFPASVPAPNLVEVRNSRANTRSYLPN